VNLVVVEGEDPTITDRFFDNETDIEPERSAEMIHGFTSKRKK
jgi:hypothetical protein